ncbi:MFS transporter [Nitrospira sp. Kam-Ns4a]
MSASVTTAVRGSPWRALAHRNFALFFAGHGLSLCGTWMQSMAQAWLVYRLTGSPFMLGLVEFLSRAPILLFGLLAGPLVDRWPRRRTMLVTQTLLLLQALALGGLTLTGAVTIGWILALGFALGLISVVEVTVRQTFLTDLVPRADIPSAIGLNSSLFNLTRIIGPSLAGVLVAWAGEGLCFLLNAASFLVVLGCLAAIRVEPAAAPRHGGTLGLLAEGLAYARETPHVRLLLGLTAVLSVAAMPFATLLPVFASEILRRGPDGLGLLMAATGLGALAGALRLAWRRTVAGLGGAIARAVALFGLGLLGLAASATFWLSVLALVVVGYGLVSSLAATNTLLQSLAPERLRGRVVSLYATGSLGLTIFGSLLAGIGATWLGAPLTVALGGLVLLATAELLRRRLPAVQARAEAAPVWTPDPSLPR